MKEDLVAFKGVKEGIYIEVNGNDFLAIRKEIDNKLKKSLEFYKGVKLLGIKSNGITPEETIELKYMLKYKYNLIILNEGLPKYIGKIEDPVKELSAEDKIFSGIEEGLTKFIKGTLRSGQVLEYKGNIVIIGDVNPGALVEAGGNIIVLGTFRGVAHAGRGNNKEAIVASYKLNPTQLRIADKIARSPDIEIGGDHILPEVARIKNGEVVIEPYLPNK